MHPNTSVISDILSTQKTGSPTANYSTSEGPIILETLVQQLRETNCSTSLFSATVHLDKSPGPSAHGFWRIHVVPSINLTHGVLQTSKPVSHFKSASADRDSHRLYQMKQRLDVQAGLVQLAESTHEHKASIDTSIANFTNISKQIIDKIYLNHSFTALGARLSPIRLS